MSDDQLPALASAKADTKLTDKQLRFVDEFLASGGKGGEAARKAGYGKPNSAATAASRLLKHPEVQAEIIRRCRQTMAMMLPKALGRLDGLIDGAKSEYVQLEAVRTVLNHSELKEAPKPAGPQVAIQINLD